MGRRVHGRFYRVKLQVRRSHAAFHHLPEHAWSHVHAVVDVRHLRHTVGLLALRTLAALRGFPVAGVALVEVVGQFLVPCLVVDVGHARRPHTTVFVRVHVLESVLVKVYRRWPVPLRRGLLIGELAGEASFEATAH